MKRQLLLIAAAAVVLAACTKNDVVISDADSKIEFDVPFVGKSVKATGDLNTRNIQEQSLRIWGDKYRAGATNASDVFSTNAEDGASTVLSYANNRWESRKYAYWTDGYLYDFTTVAPSSVNASYDNSSATLSERKLTISDIPVVQLIKEFDGTPVGDDILAATNTGKSGADRTVSVSLYHLLSRFSIYLYTTFRQQTVDVESIKIYLPKNSTAEYAQAAHGRIASGTDVWTWNGFTNKPDAADESELASAYDSYELLKYGRAIPYCADQTEAASGRAYCTPKEFFIAPTPVVETPTPDDLQLYMDIVFEYGYTTKTLKGVKIQDLHSFRQGYQTNLFVRVDPDLILFDVVNVFDWNTDNNIVDTHGRSFLVNVAQNGFNIDGRVETLDNRFVGTSTTPLVYTLGSIIREGTTVDILRAPMELVLNSEGRFTIPATSLDASKIEPGKYILSFSTQQGDTYTVPLDYDVVAMQMTLDASDGLEFIAPITAGMTPAPTLFIWDETETTGPVNEITDENRKHTYATGGIKKFSILTTQTDYTKKQINAFNFNNYISDWDSRQALKSMDSHILNSEQTNLQYIFAGCHNLESVDKDLFRYLPNVTSFDGVFDYCESLKSIPEDLFAYNTQATSFHESFYYCTSLTSIPEGLFRNNTEVTVFDGTFHYCSAVESIAAGLFRNNTKVTAFIDTFNECLAIKTIGAGLFDNNTEVTEFSGVFHEMEALTEIPVDLFRNNTKVTKFSDVFSGCSNLTSAPEGLFAYCPDAYIFKRIFSNCSKLVDFENCLIAPADGITKDNRFAAVGKVVDISGFASDTGTDSSVHPENYSLPDFTEYTFDIGYTWQYERWGTTLIIGDPPYYGCGAFININEPQFANGFCLFKDPVECGAQPYEY